MRPPDDAGLDAVLAHVGAFRENVLGHGGEAWVVALDDDRVVRVMHDRHDPTMLDDQSAFLDEVRSSVPFALPETLERGEVDGRHFTIDRRFIGRSLDHVLSELDRAERDAAVANLLGAVRHLGAAPLTPRPFFGDLLTPEPVRATTWRGWLIAKVDDGLRRAPGFAHLDAEALVDAIPDTADLTTAGLLHLDAFAGNVMVDGTEVTAIIDIGHTAAFGDPRLDQVVAAVYICAEPITPTADEGDRTATRRWLADHGLAAWEEPVRRWIAAYWSWADDDEALHAWCRSVLL